MLDLSKYCKILAMNQYFKALIVLLALVAFNSAQPVFSAVSDTILNKLELSLVSEKDSDNAFTSTAVGNSIFYIIKAINPDAEQLGPFPGRYDKESIIESIVCTLDGESYADCDYSSIPLRFTEPGQHSLRVVVTLLNGRQVELEDTITVKDPFDLEFNNKTSLCIPKVAINQKSQ